MQVQMLPPIQAVYQTFTTQRGTTISATPGTAVLVSYEDGYALRNNGWTFVGAAGTTANRPSASAQANITGATTGVAVGPGFQYLDTTLGYIVVWDGAAWRNPATAASV